MKTKEIFAKVETTKTGLSAYTEKYGVYTTGATFKELRANMREALNYYFEDQKITIKPNQIIYVWGFKK